ncbi:MAG: MarR family transcriptional regulator [Alphaproteobacteria bacterium]|nr:MarR family transcriptional regulator [Alphaproteobacteria bacterium]
MPGLNRKPRLESLLVCLKEHHKNAGSGAGYKILDLAEITDAPADTVGDSLRRLEAHEYVESTLIKIDGRGHSIRHYTITPQGLKHIGNP